MDSFFSSFPEKIKMLFRKALPQAPSIFSRFGLPDKLKGGRIEKYVNYWKGVARDYRESTNDIIVGSRNKPLKAIAYSSTLLTLYYLQKTRCRIMCKWLKWIVDWKWIGMMWYKNILQLTSLAVNHVKSIAAIKSQL